MNAYLVTGVSGQDGFFSARYFLKQGAGVIGVSRRPPDPSHVNLLTKYPKYVHITMQEYCQVEIDKLISAYKPNYVLHCAGYRDIPQTEDQIAQCFFTNVDITDMLLKSLVKHSLNAKFLFISSSEIFDQHSAQPFTEESRILPANEYGKSKVEGMSLVKEHRSKGLFAVSAICLNHDSFLSPDTHLIKKIPMKLLDMKLNQREGVSFYDVEMKRDWIYAGDTIVAFDLMLNHFTPEDFLVSSGRFFLLREYIGMCCDYLGLSISDLSFLELNADTTYDRTGNPEKIKNTLGWKPTFSLKKLCNYMIRYEKRRMLVS